MAAKFRSTSQKQPTQNLFARQIQFRFEQAFALHKAGQYPRAQTIYLEILTVQPSHFDCLHNLGVLASQTGDFELAVKLLSDAIKVNPNVAAAHSNIGFALQKLQRPEEALAGYERALSLQPGSAEIFNNRGNALRDLNRPAEALASYDKALSLKPDYAESHNNRGNALKDLGRLDEALTSYDKALSLQPDHAEAHNNRGNVLLRLRRSEEAQVCYDRAVLLKPDYAEAHCNRVLALIDLGQFEKALASCDTALSLRPDYAEVYNNRGYVLLELKRPAEALASYDRLLSLEPHHAKGHYNRGNALRELRKPDQALISYDKALSIYPDYAEAYNNRGNALLDLERPDQALTDYDRVLSINPTFVEAHINRGNALLALERPDEALASYRTALSLKPDYDFLLGTVLTTSMQFCHWSGLSQDLIRLEAGISRSLKVTTPFPVLGLLDSPQLHKRASEVYAAARFPTSQALGPISACAVDGKIRLGYYSADFYNHATSYLMAELFESHDRDTFELYGFSFGPKRQDWMRGRIGSAFDRFVDVTGKTDIEVAKLSRDLGIDIAVDLKGHTQDARAGIFSERCAPIQVNYLGYPGTIGADYFDYVIADKLVIPEDSRSDFTEKVVYLPNSYQVNDSKRQISDRALTKGELGLPASGFVFCCFNRNYKILPATFDGWMRILKAVDDSVLWLLADNPTTENNLRCEAEARGLDCTRLVFAPRMPVDEHLARHRLADLFLDTLPCNAHTTASDALWAGLPVLTCMGKSFASRVAASLLTAVGLPELITDKQEDYEAKAIELARHPERIKELKMELENGRGTTPLFDAKLFARHIERAYVLMYDRHRSGLPPESMEVRA